MGDMIPHLRLLGFQRGWELLLRRVMAGCDCARDLTAAAQRTGHPFLVSQVAKKGSASLRARPPAPL